jgi:tRNA pseudouridine synthase 10
LKYGPLVSEAVDPPRDAVAAAAKALDWRRLRGRDLCDPCLGRILGKVGHGLTNAERGQVVRAIAKVPEGNGCWLCEGLFDEVPKFVDLVVKATASWEFDTFLLGSRVDAEIAAREETLWADLGAAEAEPIKAEVNREVGRRVEATLGKTVDFERPDLLAVLDTRYDHVDVEVRPLYLYGRYRKLVRGIPQTKWPCRLCRGKGCDRCGGTGKMYETSVEEIVAAAVMPRAEGRAHAFHGMGREDIDARMLGRGRPFVFEVKEPRRRRLDLAEVVRQVNADGRVEVSDLRPTTKEEVVRLKENRCAKTYRLRVRLSPVVAREKVKKGVAALRGAQVAQRTPTRVSHRRSDRVRRRRIRDVRLLSFEGDEADLAVTADAGTYVKELIHGDEGRTTPSLAQLLGVGCEVLELDVLEVHDEA